MLDSLCRRLDALISYENAVLIPIDDELARHARASYELPDTWECLGQIRELRELEIAERFLSLVEPPVGFVYLLFASPQRSSHTLVLAPSPLATGAPGLPTPPH